MISYRNLKTFCCEDISLIENYETAINDNTQIYCCHHRLEIKNEKQISKIELIKKDLYYNRPAKELIFLTRSEHSKLHFKCKNNPFRNKGKTSWNKGYFYFNNGIQEIQCKDCPKRWVKGRLPKEKRVKRKK